MDRGVGYLKGVHRIVDRLVTGGSSTPWFEKEHFVCGKCHGNGKLFYTKGGDGEDCDVCNGNGLVQLIFKIEKIN